MRERSDVDFSGVLDLASGFDDDPIPSWPEVLQHRRQQLVGTVKGLPLRGIGRGRSLPGVQAVNVGERVRVAPRGRSPETVFAVAAVVFGPLPLLSHEWCGWWPCSSLVYSVSGGVGGGACC